MLRCMKGRISSAFIVLVCALPEAGWSQTAATKTIPITIRDFNGNHSQFETPDCYGGKGMVLPDLDADRKPVKNPAHYCTTLDLKEWFQDSPSSTRYCRDLTLDRKPGAETLYQKDVANFFPIDDVPTNEHIYKADDGAIHNFHFCMEMHASFKYRGGEVFNFGGDDDVWVFINNKLAIDLGGVHRLQQDSVNLNLQKDKLGISIGNFYNFDFFYCERQTTGSDLQISTSIDLLPSSPPGYNIADANLALLRSGDTLDLPRGEGPRTFKAVETASKVSSINCVDVDSQNKTPADGAWTLGATALPAGFTAVIDPAANPLGIYKLAFEKSGVRDSIWVRVTAIIPPVAKPVADPPGKEFVRSLDIALSTSTPGAVIHYTLDGSEPTVASAIYTFPITVSSSLTLKAMAAKAGLTSSLALSETYTLKPATALRGYYQDRDGDGRIETAVLVFDDGYTGPPQNLSLTDPFAVSHVEKSPQVNSGPQSLTAVFPAFAPGTGFAPEGFVQIGAEPGRFPAQTVTMEDSVGPVLTAAKSFPAVEGPVHPALEVEFSEPVAMASGNASMPFDLKRKSDLVDAASIQVESMTQTGPGRYRLVFVSGSKYPVPGDSLRITLAAGLADAEGNRSRMSFFIPVGGNPIQAKAEIALSLEKGVTESIRSQTARDAHVVVAHAGNLCFNCDDPAVKIVLPQALPSDLASLGPTWKVTTRYPFRYSLSFFDNLGQFVNRAEGSVTADQLALAHAGALGQDSVHLQLTFLPIAMDGNTIATGAYIMKGILTILDLPAYKGSQGEDLIVVPAATTLVSRFGFLRK